MSTLLNHDRLMCKACILSEQQDTFDVREADRQHDTDEWDNTSDSEVEIPSDAERQNAEHLAAQEGSSDDEDDYAAVE